MFLIFSGSIQFQSWFAYIVKVQTHHGKTQAATNAIGSTSGNRGLCLLKKNRHNTAAKWPGKYIFNTSILKIDTHDSQIPFQNQHEEENNYEMSAIMTDIESELPGKIEVSTFCI